MDKQKQQNDDFRESLRKDDFQEREVDQDAFKADSGQMAMGDSRLEKGQYGVARDHDRDALDKQQQKNEEKQRDVGFGKNVEQDWIGREEVGKDQEWSQKREQRFGQAQDRIQPGRPEKAEVEKRQDNPEQDQLNRQKEKCESDLRNCKSDIEKCDRDLDECGLDLRECDQDLQEYDRDKKVYESDRKKYEHDKKEYDRDLKEYDRITHEHDSDLKKDKQPIHEHDRISDNEFDDIRDAEFQAHHLGLRS